MCGIHGDRRRNCDEDGDGSAQDSAGESLSGLAVQCGPD